jgi:MFS-type transporter involved in bile tolerance (Atg22 family)
MITYLSDTLDFSSTENGIAILCMLIGSIPGAVVAGKSHKHWNPIRGSILATLVLLVNTVVAAIVLKEPGQQVQTYVFGVCYGLGIGWKWTTDKLLASVLIPEGQDAELMGVYLFAGQILTWLPPLVFTALNEAGVSQRVGIGTLGIYFFLGMIALAMMGSYREAIQVAGRHVLPDASQHQQQNNWDESAITSNGDCRPTGQEKFEVEVAHIDSKGGGSLKTD